MSESIQRSGGTDSSGALSKLDQILEKLGQIQGRSNINTSINIKTNGIKDLEKANEQIEQFTKLNKNSRGNYFTSQEKALAQLNAAYDKYIRKQSSGETITSGDEGSIVRWTNAYKALGGEISNIDDKILTLSHDLESKLNMNTSGSWQYTVDMFKELFGIMHEMQANGFDMSQFSKNFDTLSTAAKAATKETQDILNDMLSSDKKTGRPLITEDMIMDSDVIKERIAKITAELNRFYSKLFDDQGETGASLTSKQGGKFVEYFTELETYLDKYGKEIPEKYQQLYDTIDDYVLFRDDEDIELKKDPFVNLGFDNVDKYIEQAERALQKQKELQNEINQPSQNGSSVDQQDQLQHELQETAEQARQASDALKQIGHDNQNDLSSDTVPGVQQVEQLVEVDKRAAEAAENAAEKQRQLAEAARETGNVQADGGIVSATGNAAVGEQSIANETSSLDGLITKLQEVATAIDAKTNAFRMEGETVDGVVQSEINMLDALLGEVNMIITDLQKLSEAITTLPEISLKMKEVGEGSTIDSQATANLEKIKNLFENFSSDNITKICSAISGIKISKATTQNLQDFAIGIELLRETLKSFEGDATSVLGQISDLAAQADGLKALGDAIKSTSSQRTQAQQKLADLGANRITDVDKAWDAAIAENEQFDMQKRIALYNELSESALEYYKLKEKEGKGKATLEETARLTELSKKFEEATANAKKYGDAMSEAEKKAVVGLTKSQNEAQQQIAQNLVSGIQSQIDKMEQTTGRNSAYNAEIDKVKAKYDDLKAFIQTIDWNGDAEAQLAEVKKQVENIQGGIRTANTGREFREANSTRISTLDRRMSEWMNNNSGAGEYLEQVRQLKATLESIGSQAGLDQVSRQFEEIRSNAAEAGKVGKSFGETLKGSFGNLSRYLMTFASFYRIIATLREAVGVVRELDTALTEMRKVSDESLSTLQKYQLESFDMADQVGTTAVQIQNSTADWLRLGRSFEESKSLASLSTKLLNVSEFENIADATKSLVSATQAYDEIDPNAIVDKLNLIGNNYAVSTDELAQGLQNAAAVLKTQGNDLDKALALLTSGNVIGQNMSKSSAGIRTISLRIAGTEEAKQEIAD